MRFQRKLSFAILLALLIGNYVQYGLLLKDEAFVPLPPHKYRISTNGNTTAPTAPDGTLSVSIYYDAYSEIPLSWLSQFNIAGLTIILILEVWNSHAEKTRKIDRKSQ